MTSQSETLEHAPSGRVSARSANLIWLLALLPLAFFVQRFDFVCDDAFITYRYAENLAEGHGLRYNLGVEPPVEGYTDLGWVLWIALFKFIGFSDPVLISKLTTILCGVLLLRLVVLTATRLGLGTVATASCALFFACLPQVGTWSTGGLGTMAFALFIFATTERLLRGEAPTFGVQAGLLAAVVATLRADGAYWLACAGVLAWLLRSDRESRRALIRYAILCALAIGALMLVRVLVHGDWVPNTARAKVAFSALTLERGLMYLATFLIVLPAGLLLPVGLLLQRSKEPRSPLVLGSLLMVLATYVYSVLVGGDFMCWSRFILPALPFLALLIGVFVERFVRRGATPVGLALALILIGSSIPAAFGVHFVSEPVRKLVHFRWGNGYTPELMFWNGMKSRAERWIVLGKALGYHTEEGESIVMGRIGAAGYYSRLFVYDRRGLVTPEVNEVPVPKGERTTPGHDRQVPVSFFAKYNPTYLEASMLASSAPTPSGTPKREITRLDCPESEGFPPNRTLILIRARRKQE